MDPRLAVEQKPSELERIRLINMCQNHTNEAVLVINYKHNFQPIQHKEIQQKYFGNLMARHHAYLP